MGTMNGLEERKKGEEQIGRRGKLNKGGMDLWKEE
jgi:hypothetical protein